MTKFLLWCILLVICWPLALIALGPVLDALLADQEAAREEFAEAFEEFELAAGDKRVRKAFGP